MAVKQKKEEQGYVLILVLLLLILMVIVTPSLFLVSTTGYATSKKDDQMQQARYLADIAYQLAWQVIQQNTTQNSGTLRVTTDESTIMQALWNIPNISPKTTDNGTYSISSYLDENYSVGKNQLATSGWPHIYYIRASGQVPKAGNPSFVTSNIDFKLVFDQQRNQIVLPSANAISYSYQDLYNQVKNYLVYDPMAGNEAAQDLAKALQSAVQLGSYSSPLFISSTQTAVDQAVRANPNANPLVLGFTQLKVGYDPPNYNGILNIQRTGSLIVVANAINTGGKALNIYGPLICTGDATFTGGVKVHVYGPFLCMGNVNFDGGSTVDIEGPFATAGKVTISGGADVTFHSDWISSNGGDDAVTITGGNTTVVVQGQMAVQGTLKLTGGRQLEVSGPFAAQNVILDGGAQMSTEGGASIVGQFSISGGATYEFGGNTLVGQKLGLSGGAKLSPQGSSAGNGMQLKMEKVP